MSQTVFFLGASGKVARHAAPVFQAAGWHIKFYDRKRGDMTAQAQGADVIVNGLNPPNYHDWSNIVPAITRDVIAAARSSGATVILPGNVYVFGDQPGTWTEDTPHRPNSRKGQIRQAMEESYARSGVQTINLRTGDFISADPGGNDVMNLMILRGLARGKVTSPGDPNAMHAFGFLPDWARAARLLAEKRHRLGQFTDLNLGGANFSIEDLRQTLSTTLQRPLTLSRFPWPLLCVASPFLELAREMREMQYLWNVPHALSQDRLLELLPDYQPTDINSIMRAGRSGEPM